MTTLGVIVGNRGFFPDHLCKTGREVILQVLEEEGIGSVILPRDAAKFGAVETLQDARKCADLFKERREEIDGALVTLPNFGDERAVANTVRMAGLDVPILVHAFPDDATRMSIADRRDSFCGKISVCNNLRQYGLKFSLTRLHTVGPDTEEFRADLRRFAAICRVVRDMRGARFGALGARPGAFNTVRYSEKILEANGITIETLDLSEALGWARRMGDGDPPVKEKLHAIRAYTGTDGIPEESLLRMAKLGVAIDKWAKDNALVGTAIQCWTSLEEFYGVVPCALMSMMSESLTPSACEVDVTGLIGMYALQSASGRPSALLDWNNNYGDNPNKGVALHCSNLPKSVFADHRMDCQEIIAGSVGSDNAYGAVVGRMKEGPFTFCRVSTDDAAGEISGYVGEGMLTADPLETFGGYGVFEIPNLQGLMRYVCECGFEHHVAMNLDRVADAVYEALANYLEWDIYCHKG
ncbi:MAG TPA: L-fucose/L-arabinose isomerase family protein [Sumerlaeia bacterium]|nr:L-fucose/L-arabinose isomerase family protein [Sumerlaeia bacterium]